MDLLDAFKLGGSIEYIRVGTHLETVVKTRKRTGYLTLLEAARSVFKFLEETGINSELQEMVNHWKNKFEREYKSEELLKHEDAEELSEDMSRFEQMLSRELVDHPIIELTQKGALSSRALISTSQGQASSIFDKEIWLKLPSIAKNDFSDAAKCLLVEASTPAAMVALRGMEAVVREYYKFKVGKECGKKSLGVVIEELRSLPNANTKLLGYLDYLRSEKRNLAQHPDKIFNQREAERIFMEILSAIHDVYSEIT